MNECINICRFNHAIITISFHPSGSYLAVASGQMIKIWNWRERNTDSSQFSTAGLQNLAEQYNKYNQNYRYSIDIQHDRSIRAIMFHPHGDYLFIAAPYLDRGHENSKNLVPCR